MPLGGDGEVARLPARMELRIEAVQALDLEVRVREPGEAADEAFGGVPRPVHEPRERGEVERDLFDAGLAELFDRVPLRRILWSSA